MLPDIIYVLSSIFSYSFSISSYSSYMSPTISSIMSSIVISPAVPPYSSTIIAICFLFICNSLNNSFINLFWDTKYASFITFLILNVFLWILFIKSFTYKTPFTSSIVSSYTGILLCLQSSFIICSKSSSALIFISTAKISVLCVIISDTVISLNSNTLFISSFSSSSIVPLSSPWSTIILISSSVTISSSFSPTPNIFDIAFVVIVSNFTNGAVIIEISRIIPIVPNAIFS